jgi:ribosomal protein L34E
VFKLHSGREMFYLIPVFTVQLRQMIRKCGQCSSKLQNCNIEVHVLTELQVSEVNFQRPVGGCKCVVKIKGH